METIAPPRNEIPVEYTWNAPSVFSTVQDWEAECERLSQNLAEVTSYRGRLSEGPDTLFRAVEAIEKLLRQVGKIGVYANMSYSVDTTNQEAARMNSKARALLGQAFASVAFLDPELIAVGEGTLQKWLASEPRLAYMQHYVSDLFRKQAHVRSGEVEELLGLLVDPFSGAETTMSLLTEADFKFKPALSSRGEQLPVNQGTFGTLLNQNDRQVRRTAWESYTDQYLAYKNTLANNLSTSIKQNVFSMRLRHHPSTLRAALYGDNIPDEVFHALIDTYRKNLPIWHRYWAVRRKALGVETLYPYDIWAPLSDQQPKVPYSQAVDWICEALAPMGEGYVSVLRGGCLEQRWVDIYPNLGKSQGAFSSGWPGTYPFILMSYDDSTVSVGALAHELGHSMHSYLTWENQPFLYASYSSFVAEVASNFHQAMLRAYLLEIIDERQVQIAVIEEAMANFHRYFFIMPTLARFELETHQRIERGDGLSADDMIELMADLFTEAYGGEMQVDRLREGITWATFPHLYMDYYVFQYATGISGAHALAKRVLTGQPGAVEAYLGFLKSGSSDYPLEVLRKAGVDLRTPEAVEQTYAILSEMVDRLERLVS